jgi:hypothetical protein
MPARIFQQRKLAGIVREFRRVCACGTALTVLWSNSGDAYITNSKKSNGDIAENG